eukprot:1380080-Rhodomonas_salina.1
MRRLNLLPARAGPAIAGSLLPRRVHARSNLSRPLAAPAARGGGRVRMLAAGMRGQLAQGLAAPASAGGGASGRFKPSPGEAQEHNAHKRKS